MDDSIGGFWPVIPLPPNRQPTKLKTLIAAPSHDRGEIAPPHSDFLQDMGAARCAIACERSPLNCVETLKGSPPIAQQRPVALSQPKIYEFAVESTLHSSDGIFGQQKRRGGRDPGPRMTKPRRARRKSERGRFANANYAIAA